MLPNDDHFETIEEKNKILLEELNEFQRHLIYADELIHTVDNLCTGSDRDKTSQYLREKLFHSLYKMVTPKEEQIPIKYYLFDLLVKNEIKLMKKKHGVLTIDECNDIGQKLGMTLADVKAAIRFYNLLNVYLYFEDIPDLQHIVFTNPQYPLDLLCKLIQETIIDPPLHLSLTNEFRVLKSNGILHESILKDSYFKQLFIPPLFQHDHLLKLLSYTHIISLVSPSKYFMPIVLPKTDDKDPDVMLKKYTERGIDPIFIKFKCGSVPQGVFLTVIANLLRRQHPPKFSIRKDNNDKLNQKQLRYSIELSFDNSRGYLLLIDEFKWIKIYYDYYGETHHIAKVREAISKAIKACVTILSYSESALSHEYLPPCSENNDHPVTEIFLNDGNARCDCKRPLQKLQESQLSWFSKGNT
jgi:hypothetical protein